MRAVANHVAAAAMLLVCACKAESPSISPIQPPPPPTTMATTSLPGASSSPEATPAVAPSTPDDDNGKPWWFGTQDPLRLLDYEPWDASERFCKSGTAFLAELKNRVVPKEKPAGTDCRAKAIPLLNNATSLQILCDFSDGDAGRSAHYWGLIWAENSNTAFKYTIYGYGWVRDTVDDDGDNVYNSLPLAKQLVDRQSTEFQRLVDKCTKSKQASTLSDAGPR